MSKTGIIFCNGEMTADDLELARKELKEIPDAYVIGCDGGGRYLAALDKVPHICLGDFDSLEGDILSSLQSKGSNRLDYPCDKDYIDMVLGIEEARRNDCNPIIIYGAFGGRRSDMFFGNILAVCTYDEEIILKSALTTVFCIRPGKTYSFAGKTGDYVSLMSVASQSVFESSSGLKYDLKDICLTLGETRGISNELTAENASVKLNSGKALLFLQK